MSINSNTSPCECSASKPVVTSLISALAENASPDLEFAAHIQHAFDLSATVGLVTPEGNSICAQPNPPRWCWAAEPSWVRDLVFQQLAEKGLGLRKLGLRINATASFAEVMPFVLHAAASSDAFAAIDHGVALDAIAVLQAAAGVAHFVEGSRWENICKRRPWPKICGLIEANEILRRPPVPELVAIGLGHALGLLDDTTTRLVLRGRVAGLERQAPVDLRPNTYRALLSLLDEGAASKVVRAMSRFGTAGLVTPDSNLCTRRNWVPWCAYASSRPFLARFVDAALETKVLTPETLDRVAQSAGIIVTVG